jgi:hypothetical protein
MYSIYEIIMTDLKIYNAIVYSGIWIVLYTFTLIGITNYIRPHVLNRPYAWIKLSVIHSVTNFIGISLGILLLGWYDFEYTDRDEMGVIPFRQFVVLCIIFWLIATVRIYNILLCSSMLILFTRQDPQNTTPTPTPTPNQSVVLHV